MNINDDWKIDDEVSGLSIKILPGENLDRLQIRNSDNDLVRDFWFTKDGDFDGTGAYVGGDVKDSEEVDIDG